MVGRSAAPGGRVEIKGLGEQSGSSRLLQAVAGTSLYNQCGIFDLYTPSLPPRYCQKEWKTCKEHVGNSQVCSM